MKRIFWAFALSALLLAVAGCEEEEFARPAVFGDIYCTPSEPKIGDTVTFTVVMHDPGNRIYHADYVWSCNGNFSKEEVRVTAPDGSKTIKAAPTFKWVFRKFGTFTVTMSARFKYSMADENGAMIGGASASGSVKVKSK